MRKFILFLFIGLFVCPAVSFSQDADESFKQAKKLKFSYSQGGSDADKLLEAKTNIDAAVAGISSFDEKKAPSVYQEKGEIYNLLAASQPDTKKEAAIPLGAKEAFMNAYNKATKGYHKKDAMQGMAETAGHLNSAAGQAYKEEKYEDAYKCFKGMLDINDVLTENKFGAIPIPTEEKYNEIAFFAAISAQSGGMKEASRPLFEKLKAANYDNPYVYEALFDFKLGEDETEALKMLDEGRAKYPKDLGLLYAEINYYIQNQKLDDLIGKIKDAIAQDPENVSLYTSLGSVYDNLSQRRIEEGNEEQAQEYFNNALDYYGQALEKEGDNVDALYSIGVLYYNKAAGLSEEMVALQDDLSKEGMRKYEAKKSEMLSLFDKALPYFKRAEIINPNDRNTLIALKEIFAKRGGVEDLKISGEFKKRLEIIEAGGSNESSYYNE